MDIKERSLALHEQAKGKIEVVSKVPLDTRDDLALAYTPGVAESCLRIAANPDDAYRYTIKQNTVAVVSDGSAVLGLGNIGPLGAIPVMEGKAALFKKFGGVDAFPIVVATQDVDEIVETVLRIEPVFGGINLEDIAAPRCFEVEEKLRERASIPVFHDDQHGTAVVVLAGLLNALRVAEKNISDIRIIISGAGAAGTAVTKLLLLAGATNVVVFDSEGAVYEGRPGMNSAKQELARITNREFVQGALPEALRGADVFIGVSKPGVLTAEMVQAMAEKPIIFGLANPTPEIMPDEAKRGGAFIVATGRSDFPNQVNNALIFPGFFRGLLDARATRVSEEMKLAAARALAGAVENPTVDNILPSILDATISHVIAEAVRSVLY